jgi:hypothetical protein
VSDFDAWMVVCDQRLDAQLTGEVIGHPLVRAAADPDQVELLMEFASLDDAEAYREYMDSLRGARR